MPFLQPSQPIRLLLIEDSAEDAELLVDQLAAAGMSLDTRRVEDQRGLERELDRFRPDLILSDHALPGYSGSEALALVRERAPLTPFIYVTGTIGEEAAVEGLRAGANDYILKHNTARLASAVERALREARAELERRHAEAELLRAQRMEGLALLTSGLGHDLRNVLQPLLIVPSILRDHSDHPQLLRIADLVNDCAVRGLDMVGSMLAFARGDGNQDGTVDIASLFSALRLMVHGTVPRNVELHFDGEEAGLSLRANRTELQQSLLNLMLNGIQAMPEGGRLEVSAQALPSGGVCLSVEDSGQGMDEDVKSKLFTPFFTTKAGGTGLGLHSCRRIVEAHGGWIEIDTQPGRGTRFELHFPEPSQRPVPEDDPEGRGERLLLVDEDQSRLTRLARVLDGRGYQLRTAVDGATALQHLDRGELPDLVIIADDLSLLSTVQTLGALQRRDCRGPVLVLTADHADPERDGYPREMRLSFLPRSADPATLLQTLRDLLGHGTGAESGLQARETG